MTAPTSLLKSPSSDTIATTLCSKSQSELTTSALRVITTPNTAPSHFRRVFQTSEEMKTEFTAFLKTIFFQLDEKKVFEEMEKLLDDPHKTDEQVYKDLSNRINSTKKRLPILSRLWSLYVLKKGMGQQAFQLLKDFDGCNFHDYLEIYDRRYHKTLQSTAKLSLDKKSIAACDFSSVSLIDRIQAGALFSSYPYKTHINLNDPDCTDPLLQPEKTHKPLGKEVEDHSLDLIGCLGGLHHVPEERKDAFVDSLHKKLRPGGIILFRDHDAAPGSEVEALASVVHSFVNAADHIPWKVESKEIRTFKSIEDWTTFMQSHGFTRISKESLVLKDDPTQNAMIAFVKTPKTLEELKTAISYRNDCTRPKQGTRATWIEWGNVRSSKQYADFIQNHHAYAFDFIGHIRQHWQHFYHFITESRQDPDIRLKDLVFSNDMAMNLFILLTATIQYSISSAAAFPNRLIARWQHGDSWHEVCNLSALETFEAENEKEYANFIDHTPFYSYPYLSKMKQMWQVIWNSQEPFKVKIASFTSAIFSSIGFISKAAISAPIRAFYTAEANQEPETIKILIKDPDDELHTVIEQWEKDPIYDEKLKIEVIYQTEDHHKLVSIPRYKPFTTIFSYLNKTNNLELLEVGNQKEISIDLFLDENTPNPSVPRFIYELKKLQDSFNRRYVTYQTNVCALKNFKELHIEYIHE